MALELGQVVVYNRLITLYNPHQNDRSRQRYLDERYSRQKKAQEHKPPVAPQMVSLGVIVHVLCTNDSQTQPTAA